MTIAPGFAIMTNNSQISVQLQIYFLFTLHEGCRSTGLVLSLAAPYVSYSGTQVEKAAAIWGLQYS